MFILRIGVKDVNFNFYSVGVDIDYSSLIIAKRVYDDVIHASATHLPFRPKSFDISLEIGLIYLLPTLRHKVQTLREMSRISNFILLIEGNNSDFRKLLKTIMLKREIRKPTIEEIKTWLQYMNKRKYKLTYFDIALHQKLLKNRRIIDIIEVFITRIPMLRRILGTFIIVFITT